MENIILFERITQNKDWATALFFVGFSILAINKKLFNVRYAEFTKLFVSDKYLKIYKDNTNLRNSFTLSFLIIQLISLSFFILLALKSFNVIPQLNFLTYARILNFTVFFVFTKYLLDKIISISFKIEEFADHLNLQKVAYRNLLGVILLFINIIIFYNNIYNKYIIGAIAITLIVTNILLYIIFIKNNQKTILNKLFYFILYLCTLEIAPYLLLAIWYKNYRA